MNRDKALRYAYGAALSGNLTYPVGQSAVQIFDEKLEASNNIYVLILNQNSIYAGNFMDQRWTAKIELEIVSKQQNSVSKDILDDISEQIENIIIPSAFTNGLSVDSGWQVINVSLESISYANIQQTETNSILTKTLIFNQTIIKK